MSALEIERGGLTTWSGNPRMIKCAERIGMQIEGVIRKVRYYNGNYYDSVKLSVLREEWFATQHENIATQNQREDSRERKAFRR